MLLLSGASKPAVCSKCEDTEGEPVYQGILEVNTKLAENTEISSLKVRGREGERESERERERERGWVETNKVS